MFLIETHLLVKTPFMAEMSFLDVNVDEAMKRIIHTLNLYIIQQ